MSERLNDIEKKYAAGEIKSQHLEGVIFKELYN